MEFKNVSSWTAGETTFIYSEFERDMGLVIVKDDFSELSPRKSNSIDDYKVS